MSNDNSNNKNDNVNSTTPQPTGGTKQFDYYEENLRGTQWQSPTQHGSVAITPIEGNVPIDIENADIETLLGHAKLPALLNIQLTELDDTANLSMSNNTLFAGDGNDRVNVSGTDNVIMGGDGNNVIHAYGMDNVVGAGDGNDFIHASGTISAGYGHNWVLVTENSPNGITLEGHKFNYDEYAVEDYKLKEEHEAAANLTRNKFIIDQDVKVGVTDKDPVRITITDFGPNDEIVFNRFNLYHGREANVINSISQVLDNGNPTPDVILSCDHGRIQIILKDYAVDAAGNTIALYNYNDITARISTEDIQPSYLEARFNVEGFSSIGNPIEIPDNAQGSIAPGGVAQNNTGKGGVSF